MSDQRKILLVEDDAINAKLVKDFLTFNGFLVVTTNNGNEVADIVAQDRPELILLDIQIFGKSGVDVAKELRADNATKNIPIFAVSAFSREKVLNNEMFHLFDEYIEKPVKFKEFMAILNSYMTEDKK